MYGNIAKAHSKDKKTRYYYYCKNTVTPTGHECSFRLNIEQTEINKFVAKVISAMVNNPRFVEAIQAKIGTAVDTEDMERQIAVLQGRLKQAFGTKSRLERQMDTLDINDCLLYTSEHLLSALCISLDSSRYHLQQSVIAPYISLPRYSNTTIISLGNFSFSQFRR